MQTATETTKPNGRKAAPKIQVAADGRLFIETEKYGIAYYEVAHPAMLTQHPRNPPQRTNPKTDAYRLLKDKVASAGGVLVPLHVSSDGIVEDGNGRRAVSLDLALTEVPILRYTKSHAELEALGLFDDLNSPTKGFKPKDQFMYALLGGEVSDMKISSMVNWVRELLTKAEMEVFMKSRPSPSMVSLAKSAARYCLERGDLLTDPQTRAFIRKTIMWLIRCKQQRPLVVYMQLKRGHARLKLAIENSRPVPALSGV